MKFNFKFQLTFLGSCNYCLEFLLTTYAITIVNETIQFTHIIVQIGISQRNNEV